MTKPSRLNKVILIAMLLACLAASFWIGIRPSAAPIHPDELMYVYYAGLFKSFFITHDIGNPLWHSDLRYDAVPAGMYFIGLTLYLSPFRSMLVEPDKVLCFRHLSDDAIAKHPLPYVNEVIHILRPRMLIFRAACVMLIWLLGWRLAGPCCGIAAIIFLLKNKLFIETTSLVLLEGIWLSQYFLNLFLIHLYLARWQKKGPGGDGLILLTLLIGLSAGLLTATKIHGALNLIIFTLCVAALLAKEYSLRLSGKKALLKSLGHLGLAAASFASIFILCNPALYRNPWIGITKIIDKRLATFLHQAAMAPGDSLLSIMSRLKFIVHTVDLSPAMAALGGVGLIWLCVNIGRSFKKGHTLGMPLIMGVSFTVTLAGILQFMKIAYARYILVLFPYIYLFICCGGLSLLKNCYFFLKGKWPKISFLK